MRGSPCPALWLCVARSCDTHTDSFSGLSVPAPPRTSSSTTAAGVHTPHSRQHPDSTPWRRQLSWQVSTMPSSDCSHSSALPPCRWPAATRCVPSALCPLPTSTTTPAASRTSSSLPRPAAVRRGCRVMALSFAVHRANNLHVHVQPLQSDQIHRLGSAVLYSDRPHPRRAQCVACRPVGVRGGRVFA